MILIKRSKAELMAVRPEDIVEDTAPGDYTLEGYSADVAVNVTSNQVEVILVAHNPSGEHVIDNVMLWIDGVLVTEWYGVFADPQWGGHFVSRVGTSSIRTDYVFQVSRTLFPMVAGPKCLTLGLFTGTTTETAAYVSRVIEISPQAQYFVTPGKIVRNTFWSSKDYFDANPTALAAFKAAGLNSITDSIFQNPVYSGASTIEQWRATSLEAWFRPKLEWCRANGLIFWGAGDDMGRQEIERNWVTSTAWAEQAIKETFALRAEYPDVWYAVSMVDEQSGAVTSFYTDLVGWCREVDGPILSWPNQRSGTADPWEQPNVADFADRYISPGSVAWRHGRPFRANNWQTAVNTAWNATAWPAGIPLAFQVSAMGPFYWKRVAGGDYQEGLDEITQFGARPQDLPAHTWLPLAYGATALRIYALDAFSAQRTGAAIGTQLETGLKIGSPEWTAISLAMNAVAQREHLLVGEFIPPLQVGPWLVGRRGGFEFWVSTTDEVAKCPVGPGGVLLTSTGIGPYQGDYVLPGSVVLSR